MNYQRHQRRPFGVGDNTLDQHAHPHNKKRGRTNDQGNSLDACAKLRDAGWACNNADHPEWDGNGLNGLGGMWEQGSTGGNAAPGGAASPSGALGGSMVGTLAKAGSFPWLVVLAGLAGLWFAKKRGWL